MFAVRSGVTNNNGFVTLASYLNNDDVKSKEIGCLHIISVSIVRL